jgi:hypothetical protein
MFNVVHKTKREGEEEKEEMFEVSKRKLQVL